MKIPNFAKVVVALAIVPCLILIIIFANCRPVISVLVEEPAPFDRQLIATIEQSNMGATTSYTYSVILKRLDTGSRRLVYQGEDVFLIRESMLRWDKNNLVIYNLPSGREFVKLDALEIHGETIYIQYLSK